MTVDDTDSKNSETRIEQSDIEERIPVTFQVRRDVADVIDRICERYQVTHDELFEQGCSLTFFTVANNLKGRRVGYFDKSTNTFGALVMGKLDRIFIEPKQGKETFYGLLRSVIFEKRK